MESSYNKDQLLNNYPDGIERHYWNSSRNKIIFDLLKKNRLSDKKILEIGCGRGVVVEFLNRKGVNCYGVDVAEGFPIYENDKIFLGTNAFDLDKGFRQSVDAILLLDVIEHIEDPQRFLVEIKKAFQSAKWHIVAVPSRQELWSNYDEFYGHHRRYSKKMLKFDLSVLNGSQIGVFYVFNMLYYPAYLLKKLGIDRNVYLSPPKGIVLKLLHSILSIIFYWEYKSKLSRFIGTSIISITKTT